MSMLTRRETESTVRPALPRVNLLPPEIAAQKRYRRLQLAAGGVAGLTVAAVALTYVTVTGQVNDAQRELDVAQAARESLQHQVSSYDNVVAVRHEVEAHQQMLKQALAGEVHWSNYLTRLSLTTPDNVWLTQMSVTQTPAQSGQSAAPKGGSGQAAAPAGATDAPAGVATITFQGVALDYNDVATWLESLTKVKEFTDPYISDSSEKMIGSKKAVGFTGTITVTQDALVPTPAGN